MRRALSLSAVLLLLWVGLALAATNVYYSVCPFGTGNLLSGGSPTIEVDSSGNAVVTLNGASLVDNIGQGVAVEYGGNKYFISGITDLTHFSLVNALGVTAPQQANTALTSVHHEYASLSAAIAGAVDADHLNGNNLVSLDIALNIACYYDHDDYTWDTPCFITTFCIVDSDCFVRVYTPRGMDYNESINCQRSEDGKWDDTKYRIHAPNENDWLSGIRFTLDYFEVDGIQVSNDKTGNRYAIYADSKYFAITNCIIRGLGVSYTDLEDCMGIETFHSASDGRFMNNVIYSDGSMYRAMNIVGEGHKIYNNIGYGMYDTGLYMHRSTPYARNNIFADNGAADMAYYAYPTSTPENCSHNLTSDDSALGSNSITNINSSDLFADPSTYDFSIKSGADSIDAGIGPALDSNVPTTDIAGNPRSGNTCSIGAFEYVVSGGNGSKWNGITPAKWNGVDWSNLKWNGM